MTVVAPDFSRNPTRRTGPAGGNVVPLARLQRSSGEARVTFKQSVGCTRLDQLHQSGCCKIRFPRPEEGTPPEAVLINTAGGLTDGDELVTLTRWREGTKATLTTQAAERVYRSRGNPAHVTNTLIVEDGATALWLPQETILFDGGRLARRFDAGLAKSATLLACEMVVFGRTAMGETIHAGNIFDSWRVRLDGRLVFADGLSLQGDMQASLDRPALGNGAQAVASLILVGEHAEELLEPVRAALSAVSATVGASVNGPILIVRLLAGSGSELRKDMTILISAMLGLLHRDTDDKTPVLPRVWSC